MRLDAIDNIARIKNIITEVVNVDVKLAEKIRTPFREQGITIVSISEAFSTNRLVITSSIVANVTGAGSLQKPAPAPPESLISLVRPRSVKEWRQKIVGHLG